MEEKNQGAAAPQAAGLPSDDHPGGPLSRAERVLLKQLSRSAMQARTLIYGMVHVLGAIPGAQKIEVAHKEAVTALDRFCLAMKTRKQGAPFPSQDLACPDCGGPVEMSCNSEPCIRAAFDASPPLSAVNGEPEVNAPKAHPEAVDSKAVSVTAAAQGEEK